MNISYHLPAALLASLLLFNSSNVMASGVFCDNSLSDFTQQVNTPYKLSLSPPGSSYKFYCIFDKEFGADTSDKKANSIRRTDIQHLYELYLLEEHGFRNID